jgi:VWFA-related protein
LDRTRFKLYEDKVEQDITHFATEDAPVSVGLIFDCSGSMTSKMPTARAAIAEFLKLANPEDEFFLFEFSSRVHRAVEFTMDSGEIQNQLTFAKASGPTALLDALYTAMNEMKHAHRSRKAILVVSDGGDNASRYSSREIKKMVQEADVQIFALAIVGPGNLRRSIEEVTGPVLLDDLARQSGGRMFEVEDLNDLPAIASKIGLALRNQYVLGYVPASGKQDGKYHRIQVKLTQAPGLPPLRTSFRSGYYAAPPQ